MIADLIIRKLKLLCEKEPQPAALKLRPGEYRNAAILFLDVVGFENLTKEFGDDNMAAIMEPTFSVLKSEVVRFGGFVDKAGGDSIIAVFGLTRAPERSEEMALRCALAISERIRVLNEQAFLPQGIRFSVRQGVNSGDVVYQGEDPDESRSSNVFGNVIVEAKRLEESAEPDKIMTSARVRQRVGSLFEFEGECEVTVKHGFKLAATYVTGVGRDLWKGRRIADGAEFIGRSAELDTALRYVSGTGAGESNLLIIRGSPGIGKTRLAYETARKTGAPCRPLLCQPFDIIPLEVLRRWLLDALGLPDGVHIPRMMEELKRLYNDTSGFPLQKEFLDNLENCAVWLSHKSASTVSQAISRQIGETAYSAQILIGLWAYKTGAAIPMIVIDDIQWADEGLARALPRIVGEPRPVKVCYLLCARPEYEIPAWAGALKAEVIELAELSSESSRELATALIPDAGEDVIETVVSRTEGNPLFIEECCRLIADAGLSKARAGELTFLPDSIAPVIRMNVDRLPSLGRRLLQTASVLGNKFENSLLDSMLTELSDGEDLRLAWNDVQAGGFLKSVAATDESEFSHPLVAQVCHQSILESNHRLLHRIAAEAIERNGPHLVCELASHFRQAEVIRKAVEYGFKAVEIYYSQGLFEKALAEITGLETMEDFKAGPSETAGLELLKGRSFLALGNAAKASVAFERAIEAAGGNTKTCVRALLGNAQAQHVLGRHDKAFEFAAKAHNAADDNGWTDIVAEAKVTLGEFALEEGSPEAAMNHFAKARMFNERVKDHALMARALSGQAQVHIHAGRGEAARQCLLANLDYFKSVKGLAGQALTLLLLGETEAGEGKRDAAAQRFVESADAAKKLGDTHSQAKALLALGDLIADSQGGQALDRYQSAIKLLATMGGSPALVRARYKYALLAQKHGEIALCADQLEKSSSDPAFVELASAEALEVLFLFCDVCFRQRRLKDLQGLIARCASLADPVNRLLAARIAFRRGLSYELMNMYEMAVSIYEDAYREIISLQVLPREGPRRRTQTLLLKSRAMKISQRSSRSDAVLANMLQVIENEQDLTPSVRLALCADAATSLDKREQKLPAVAARGKAARFAHAAKFPGYAAWWPELTPPAESYAENA